ncbi:MAG: hypothetical protein J6X78_03535 [Treponema sp.]|nr:hypothetical protein [Treponema sp.]
MKRLFIGIFVFCILVLAASATSLSLVKDNYFPVETEVTNREASTYFIYAGIDSVEIVNADNKLQKTKLKKTEYTYNKDVGRISFKNPLPYENCIAKVKGVPCMPYTCYLKDFDGRKDELLVILNNITAVEKKDYVYEPKTKLLVFRPDIDISSSSYYMVYYVQTANGIVSKTISNDFNDTIAELQARHNQELFGGPLVIYKDRTGVPLYKVAKEVGFKINLLQPRACTICETYDNNKRTVTVYCIYKHRFVECTENKITEYRN